MDEYIAGVAHIPGAAWGIRRVMPYLRRWDQTSASRVDHFVANSTFVRDRVRRYYNRDAVVIHPPIEVERFRPMAKLRGEDSYLLACGALVSYKRFDLAIAAAEQLGKKLIIAGAGPMEAQLRRQAGAHTSFEIMPSDERMAALLAQAEALLFPGVEDFGMIAIEAMAAGTPVIAFEGGGARDFISPRTGLFFKEASVESLVETIQNFRSSDFQSTTLREFALNFGRQHFLGRIQNQIDTLLRGDQTT
jgi:glycosyltransferase involved in cell wall biosynthesis